MTIRTKIVGMTALRLEVAFLNAVLFACSSHAALVLQIGQNFTAAATLLALPDAGLAVSTNHVVQFIDGRYSVFSKSTGALLQTMTGRSFWTNAGVTMPSGVFASTPRVLFDLDSQRWVAAMVDVPPNELSNRFLLAITATDDPTGPWRGAAFLADPSNGYFGDSPTLGIDANAVYLCADMFDDHGSAVGSTLVSIPKGALLGNPPSLAGRTSFGLLSYGQNGAILQPAVTLGAASTAEIVLSVADLGYDFQSHSNLVAVEIQNADVPGAAVLGNPAKIPVPEYSVPLNPPQPGASDNIDDGDARISATVYRVGDIVYANHSIETNNRAAIQWFEIDAVNLNVLEAGIVSDPILDLYYPSIAANKDGVVVMAFNGSSGSNFISSYAILGEPINGRLQFGSIVLLKEGVASYRTNSASNPWGNYSATVVDPADPAHFWAMTMYASSPSAWGTQISDLIAAPLLLSISRSGTNILVSWPSAAIGYQLQFKQSLSTSNWATIPQSPIVNHNQLTVSLSASGDSRFFRLIK